MAHAPTERRWQIVQTAIGMGLLAIAAWFGSQFMDVRDGVHELRSTLPYHFQAIEGRLGALEQRQSNVETELHTVNQQTKP